MSFLMLLAAGIAEFQDWQHQKPIRLKGKRAIRDYMYRWIAQGGRTAIFSRDLSWVDDDEMITLLTSKAKQKELIVTAPAETPLLVSLRTAGAQVNLYPELSYIPQSRFTIINYERGDARLAIGRSQGELHFVEEVSAGDHPSFAMANDLIKIIDRVHAGAGRS